MTIFLKEINLGISVCVCVCACVCSIPQSCLILCNPVDCSPPGSSVHGIFQTIILEWVSISCSRGFSWPKDQTSVSWVSCMAGGFFTTMPSEKSWSCWLRVRIQFLGKQVQGQRNALSVKVTQSCPTLATPWTVAHKVPLSMGFSRQEYWSGLPFPSPNTTNSGMD